MNVSLKEVVYVYGPATNTSFIFTKHPLPRFLYRSIPAQNYIYIRWKIHLAFTLRSIIIIYQEIIVLHLSPMYR